IVLAIERDGMPVAIGRGAREQGELDFFENRRYSSDELIHREEFLLLRPAITPRNGHASFFKIARREFDAQRHALFSPVPILRAAAKFAFVHFHANLAAARRIGTGLK